MHTLPPLPFAPEALQPHMSPETLRFHHDHHHKAYVDKLNGLVAGTRFETMSLDQLIAATRGSDEADGMAIFNNAGQHWNHSLFWQSLSPDTAGGAPGRSLAGRIERDLGGVQEFRKVFHEAGMEHFGSGWVWLGMRDDKLLVTTTHDGDTLGGTRCHALLVCDLWEHAYYLDHQNRRADYLDAFLDHLANWTFAESRLAELVRA